MVLRRYLDRRGWQGAPLLNTLGAMVLGGVLGFVADRLAR